ncbi:MAG: hypothetical protein ACM34K_06660 [Bacillota bacterium]
MSARFIRAIFYCFFATLSLTGLNLIYAQDKDQAEDETQQCKKSFASLNLGADLVSRYVWRGNEIGAVDGSAFGAPHIQPFGSLDLNFKQAGTLSLGIWGSYAFTGKYSENDFSLKYAIELPLGAVSATVTDYYFPYIDSLKFSDFSGDGLGAHTVEAALAITGPEEFPLTILISKNIHNDPVDNKSFYVEAGYGFSIAETPVSVFLGAAQGVSIWHNVSTDKMELTNIGFNVTKDLKLTNDYSMPLGLSFVYNPHIKNSYLIFKLSI